MKEVDSFVEPLSRKIWGHAPVEKIGINIPSIWEDFCRSALRSWTQILNDEGALGITARSSLHGAASKCQHWPLELTFHSRNSGSPLCPSILARNMATLLDADPHPTGGPKFGQGTKSRPASLPKSPYKRMMMGALWPSSSAPNPRSSCKSWIPMGKRVSQLGPNPRPSTGRPPLLSRRERTDLGQSLSQLPATE